MRPAKELFRNTGKNPEMCMLEMLWLELALQMERDADDEFGGGTLLAAAPLNALSTGIGTWARHLAQVARRELARFLPELDRASGHGPFQIAVPVTIDRTGKRS
jgi:hypothetical protein